MSYVQCPFRLCFGQVELIMQQAAPDDDETTENVIEAHTIIGEHSRFGGCPASLMRLPLDGYCDQQLDAQYHAIERILVAGEKVASVLDADGPRVKGTPPGHPWFDDKRIDRLPGGSPGGVNVPTNGFAGQGVVPLADGPHAGPGPGRASAPNPPKASDIVTKPATPTSTGGFMSDSLRDQLRSLCLLAIEGFGQEQEQCSVITSKLDEVVALIDGLTDTQVATHQLAAAAVGSRMDTPQPAAHMLGASLSVAELIEKMRAGTGMVRHDADNASAYAGAAAESGREYLAII